MVIVTGEIVEAGIDWLTAVGFASEVQEQMQNEAARLILQEGSRGNDCRPWRFAGYEGFKCGSVQVGSRADSTCVRLGSHVAASNWSKLYLMCESITRVDVQVTMRVEGNAARALRVVHRQALRNSSERKDGPCVTLISSNDGSGTVYLGKRTSDVFGRIYLKGVESGLEEYEGTIRFEMELKGTHASQALRLIHRSIPQLVAIASLVSTFLEKRGCNVRIPSANNLQLCSSRHRSDNERRLKWLATQVRPSVQLLIAAGCYNEVVEALGISPCGDDSSSHLN